MLERAVADAAGGSHTLTEADFSALCRRYALPWPDRQAPRRDAKGKNRWLDVEWYDYGLIVEIDGAGHMELRQWCDDSLRDAAWVATGARVMRLPSIVVRDEPELVATLVGEALRGGWVPTAA